MIRYGLTTILAVLWTTLSAQIDSIAPTLVGPGEVLVQTYTDISKPDLTTSRFVDRIFQQTSLSQLLDNHIDDVHVHLETTADYDYANPYLNAFTGASFKWTKYYYDGIRINNPLIAGDAAHHLPMVNTDLTTDRLQGTIGLDPYKNPNRSLLVKGTRGNLGGRVGFTDWFLNNISGHRSAGERQIFDIQQRPFSNGHTEVIYQESTPGKSNLILSAGAGNRVHVDQDYNGVNTSYNEEYLRLTAGGTLTNKAHFLGNGVNFLGSYSERDHFRAEYQYSQAETAKLIQFNTSFYTKKQLSSGEQTLALHINALRQAKVDANFSRNIIDQDGESLHPYHQDGRQQSIGLFYNRKEQIGPYLSYEIEATNSMQFHNPSTENFSNAIYRQSTDDNYRSLHVIDWTAAGFNSGLLENSGKLKYEWSGASTQIQATGGVHLYGMLVRENSLISLAPSLDLRWQSQLSKAWSIAAAGGFYPNRYDIDQIRLLSPDYLNGTAYYWQDTNNNQRASDDERGAVAFTTGGAYRQQGEGLGVSNTYYLDVPFTYKPSKQWQWTLVAQYRQYRDTWAMEYDQPADQYGSYQQREDRAIWFANGGEKRYEVQPMSADRMSSGGEANSFLFDQPFYAGATFRFQHQSKRWYFAGSMTANMIVGYAGLGNGPLHNNINAPSETTANPNTLINQVGRLDTDRSFISRIIANYRYNKKGSLGVQLKYKDGQSFAYYEHYLQENARGTEIAFYQPEVRGDNPLTAERGRREDFFINFELHGQYEFNLSKGKLTITATLHNLLDFANETSEYIYGNVEGFSRAPLELQVPRSASLMVAYTWL